MASVVPNDGSVPFQIIVLKLEHKPDKLDEISHTLLYNQHLKLTELDIKIEPNNLGDLLDYDEKGDRVLFKMGSKILDYRLPKAPLSQKMPEAVPARPQPTPKPLPTSGFDDLTSPFARDLGNQDQSGLSRMWPEVLTDEKSDPSSNSWRNPELEQLLQNINKKSFVKAGEFRWKERNIKIDFPDDWTHNTAIKSPRFNNNKFFNKTGMEIKAFLAAQPISKNEKRSPQEIFSITIPDASEAKEWLSKPDLGPEFNLTKKTRSLPSGVTNLLAVAHFIKGGCMYELSVYGPEHLDKEIEAELFQLLKNTDLIDPEKDISEPPLAIHQFAGGGFTIDLSGSSYIPAIGIMDHSFGAQGQGVSIQSATFDLPEGDLPLELLAKSYFQISGLFQIITPDEQRTIKFVPIALPSGEAIAAHSIKPVNMFGNMMGWQYWSIRNGNKMLIVILMRYANIPITDELEEQLFAAISKAPITGAVPKSANLQHQIQRSICYNQFGVSAIQNGKVSAAIFFFKKALETHAGDQTVFENTMQTMFEQGLHQQALDVLGQYESSYQHYQGCKIWKASLSLRVGRNQDSATLYEGLYKDGFREPGHMQLLIQALQNSGKLDRAVEISKELWEGNKNHESHLNYATALWIANKPEKALIEYASLAKELPHEEIIIGDYAELLFNTGDFHAVLAAGKNWQNSAEIKSARIHYFVGLAQVELIRYKEAMESFQAALELAPGTQSITRSIAQLRLLQGQGDRQGLITGLPAIEIPKAVRESAIAAAQHQDSRKLFEEFGAGVVEDIKIHAWEKGVDARMTRYQKIEITGTSGINRYSNLFIYFHPIKDEVCVNQLIIRDRDGKQIGEYHPEDAYVVDDNSGLATGAKVLQIPVAGLKIGAEIEFIYTIRQLGTSESIPLIRTVFAQIISPCIYRAEVIAADCKQLKWRTHGKITLKKQAPGLIFETTNQKPIQIGNNMPLWSDWLPYIIVADKGNSWQSLARAYLKDIEAITNDEPGGAIIADELKLSGLAAGEIVQKISSWIARSFQYQGLEFGRHARIPAPAQKTMMRKFGDCKDLSVLAMVLLKNAGLQVQLALVSTGDRIIQQVPSLDQFDHMILYLPQVNGGIFVDPTAKYLSLAGAIPQQLLGHQALILDLENPRFIPIREASSLQRKTKITRNVRLDVEKRELQVEEKIIFSPAAAPNFRSYLSLSPPAQHQELIQSVLQSKGDRVVVEKFESSGIEDTAAPLELKVSYRILGQIDAWQGEGPIKLPGLFEYFLLNQADQEKRDAPLKIHVNSLIETEINFTPPLGFLIVAEANESPSKHHAMQLKRSGHIEASPEKWTLHHRCEVLAGETKAEQLSEFAKERRKACAAVAPSLRLEKAP